MVLGHREHVATICRRLRNARWKTHAWYPQLYERLWTETPCWERRIAATKRQWMLGSDTTYPSTMSVGMVTLVAGASADWWTCHTGPVPYDRHQRPPPKRWQAQVLACTDPTATVRQVVDWYEGRWHMDVCFSERKSRRPCGCDVLVKFEAVERYRDLLLLGFLLLAQPRLRDMQRAGPPSARGGADGVQARTTDRLRSLEALGAEWNASAIERRIRTPRGRQRLLRELRQRTLRVA